MIAEVLNAPNIDKEIGQLMSDIKMKNSEIVDIIKAGVVKREDRSVISEKCKEKHNEISILQEQLNTATAKQQLENSRNNQLREIYDTINNMPGKFTEYDDVVVRKMVSKVKILSKEEVEIMLFNTVTLTVSL